MLNIIYEIFIIGKVRATHNKELPTRPFKSYEVRIFNLNSLYN